MISEYRTLLPHLRKYRWRYAAGILCLVAVDAAQVLIPRYLRTAVDLIAAGSYALADIVPTLVTMVLLAAFISVGRFLWRYFINIASRRIEAEMRERLFAHIMKMPARFFRENNTGDLMARATNDISTIRQATGMGFVSLVDGLFMSFMILLAMFANNAGVAAWIILPLPLITVLILLFGKIVGAQFKRVQEIYGRLSTIAQESLTGIRVVQSFVKEHYFLEKFDAVNREYKKSTMELVKTFGFFFPFISFLAGISTVLLILLGGNASLRNRMSAGSIVAMLSYLEMLVWPLMGAGFTVNIVQRGAASLKRINEVLDADPEPDSGSPELQSSLSGLLSLSGPLSIRHLSYRYPEANQPSLNDITLSVPEGSMLGILGKVGSGKSTLLKLFPRIADPGPNHVFIGKTDVYAIPLAALRRHFAMVPQESFLFSDTIRANILFAAPQLDPERFGKITAIAGLDRDIKMFPQGWDTVVGEKGISLSGGQKQRICLARALAANPPVLLLDDALSAVDAETEERILASLLDERRGKTTLVVSNRISTLRNADMIIVLDGGRIVQQGTHEELMKDQEGFYARIAMLQQLERESCEACSEKEAIDG